MKFIVSSSALLKQLQVANGVISTNTVIPILENFLFKLEPGNLKISATDLESSIRTEVSVESTDEGLVAVPARILLDTLKTLPEQPLTISIDDDSFAIEIVTDNGKFKLAGENGNEFPKIPEAEDIAQFSIASDALANAIAKTLFATSNDELRPAMTGVYFQVDPEGLTFVATDAHKLVRYKRKDVTAAESANFIVPKKALMLLKGALPSSATPVSVAYNRNNAFFSFDNMNLICRLIDARYPDYNAVIPKDNPNRLNISRAEFLNSLKRISIYSNKTTHQVILGISGNEINVSAQDLDFSNEANEKLLCRYEGEDLEIGFNAKFLVEMLGVLKEDDIQMELSTSSRAGLLYPSEMKEEEEILMLAMPVMLNS